MNRNLTDSSGKLDPHAYYGNKYLALTARVYEKSPSGKDTLSTRVFWISPDDWRKIKQVPKLQGTDAFIDFGEYSIRYKDILSVQNLHIDERTPEQKRQDETLVKQGRDPIYMPLWLKVQKGLYIWDEHSRTAIRSTELEKAEQQYGEQDKQQIQQLAQGWGKSNAEE